MKMGNRIGTEPTSLAFRARVLTVRPLRILDVTTLPMSTCLCDSLIERSVETTEIPTATKFPQLSIAQFSVQYRQQWLDVEQVSLVGVFHVIKPCTPLASILC